MYQIIIKIPKEYYNEEQIADIKNDALVISDKFGAISVSNDSFEIVGYTSESVPNTDDLEAKYENIIITSLEVVNE